MNELPVIESLCLGIDFWDCHGRKHCNLLFGRDYCFFGTVLSEMHLGNAATWEMQVFV